MDSKQQTAYQFVAECFSSKITTDYEQTWEQFVVDCAEAGEILADIVGDRVFDDWYDRLDACCTWWLLTENPDAEECRVAFRRAVNNA